MRSLDRVVSILESVGEERGPTFPATVARRVGLSLTTTARLMHELAAAGLLEEVPRGGFRLGGRFLAIARASTERRDLLDSALPEMEALRDLTGETVSLSVRSGLERVCVAEIQSLHPLRRVVPIGFTVPLHVGATGLALLSRTEDEALGEIIAALGLRPKEAAKLRSQVTATRRDGWACAVGSYLEGVAGISAPICVGETVIAALSVSGPSSRWTEDAMSAQAPAIVAATVRIGARTMVDAPVSSG